MKVNVGSWNIWVYGPRDFRGIAKVIRENNIDIIGIQEAAIYHDKKTSENIAEEIASELNYNFVFYPVAKENATHPWTLGNCIFSKYPIIESKSYSLNPSNIKYDGTYMTEPRILIHSKIQIKNKILNFLTTHLQFSLRFKTTDLRSAQVDNILKVIKKLHKPIVLAGDFNSTPKNLEIKKIESILERIGGEEPTWTVYPFEKYGWRVNNLQHRLDNIFLSKDLKYKNFKIIKSKISDHLPIKASVQVD